MEEIWNDKRRVNANKEISLQLPPLHPPKNIQVRMWDLQSSYNKGGEGQRSKINGGPQHAELLKNNVTFFHSQHKKWATCSGQIIV